MPKKTEMKTFGAKSGAKVGFLLSAVLWVIFVGSIILSFAGLLLFMALANLMSAKATGWFTLLLDSPKTWIDIFGFAVPPVFQGLLGLTMALGLTGALMGTLLAFLRPEKE